MFTWKEKNGFPSSLHDTTTARYLKTFTRLGNRRTKAWV